MLKDNIDNMIMDAIKAKEQVKASVYRLIKNEFLKYTTAKNAKPLDDAAEISILQKMVKQREEAVYYCKIANRPDLLEDELSELKVLLTLLPEIPSEEDVIKYLDDSYPNGIEKKAMGLVIKELKAKFMGVDGKMIADIVKERLI
jgi:uncharacterized protein YqeY